MDFLFWTARELFESGARVCVCGRVFVGVCVGFVCLFVLCVCVCLFDCVFVCLVVCLVCVCARHTSNNFKKKLMCSPKQKVHKDL